MDTQIKKEVREFYDQVGWQQVADGVYQNAHYEDLRPVSRGYIHRCHLRLLRHLPARGGLLLDAGSGPIQYPEYIEYSRGHGRRVCADISIVALKEARQRIGGHGLFVVADIANLPFASGVFDGAVSLHTIHHLPEDEHLKAYGEMHRVLAPGTSAAIVNGWPSSRLMRLAGPLIHLSNRIKGAFRRMSGEKPAEKKIRKHKAEGEDRKGTFTSRHDAAWVRKEVGALMPVEIYPWRSVSVRFMRALIHPWLGGSLWLGLLFWLEDRFPRYYGENGQYPLIVIHKRR